MAGYHRVTRECTLNSMQPALANGRSPCHCRASFR